MGQGATNPEQKTGQMDLYYNELRTSFSLHDGDLDSITMSAPPPPSPAMPKNPAP